MKSVFDFLVRPMSLFDLVSTLTDIVWLHSCLQYLHMQKLDRNAWFWFRIWSAWCQIHFYWSNIAAENIKLNSSEWTSLQFKLKSLIHRSINWHFSSYYAKVNGPICELSHFNGVRSTFKQSFKQTEHQVDDYFINQSGSTQKKT